MNTTQLASKSNRSVRSKMQRDSEQVTRLPSWLNDNFLLEVIREAKNDPDIALCHHCKFRSGSRLGENNASVLFRTTVHHRSRQPPQEQALDLMIKVEYRSAALRDRSLFGTEIRMYREILPVMQNVLKQARESLHVPRVFYTSEKPQGVLILEDLYPAGWVGKDQIESLEDARPAIRTIAKFHAASWLLNQTGTQCSYFRNALMEINIAGARRMFCNLYNSFTDSVGTWEDCAAIGARLQAIKPDFESKLKQIYAPNPRYNVLNHGDFHARNLLHKTDPAGGNPIVETALIDFQICHWGSPAIDLMYLLDLVVARNVKYVARENIIREYYTWFTNCLKRMSYRGWVPSWQDLQSELQRCAFLELLHDAVFEQFRYVDLSQVDVEEFFAGNVKNAGVNNERYRSLIREDLKQMLNRGVLD
ncbi:uncharacterized protein LOC129780101 [Toxorhynchites rutilus septentrionalis]|uniref:uncharacterized protein LOC129780101 n=1 Tax=Toxorhynchites rutilus septentrionalis TaxID=329112 RepID=UPI002478E8FE|nr:uncharacterized protein LOC129780101 [Toxorhynchites rutilus septentrionalis]